MKPDLKKKEAELMAAWESEPLREKLAEEIAGAFADGYTPEDCREYIEEKVLLWALDFLNRPGWGLAGNNLSILQDILFDDVVERARNKDGHEN